MFLKGTSILRRFSLSVGDKVSIKRKITAEDVQAFSRITEDYNPIHSDAEKKIVHGAFLNGLVSAVIGTALPGAGTVVVNQTLRFPKPCYVGNEVTVSVKIKSLRKLIEVEFYVYKGEEFRQEEVVLEGTAKLLVPFQEDSPKLIDMSNINSNSQI